ncbi:PIR protein [Plasmodium malariae]|uniref:PIR protein n=1 Tax=Plasmodium malariae TaxID=5858 RepID=A0A1D3TDI2_PLAMA|nr:PIR protein [Plasmodium malariae]SCP02927.1 PIR protein [Plasmodium malariae]
MTIQYKKEWDDLLKDSPAKKLYEDFHEGDNSKTSNIGCDDKSNIEKLKCMVLANLRKMNKRENMNCSNCKDCCLHFTYWIYDEIRKLMRHKENSINVSSFINEISTEGNDINNKANICPCSNYYYGNLYEFNIEKDMHDYFKNYDYLRTKCLDKKTNKNYNEYINYIKKIYQENYSSCCSLYGYEVENCEYFNCDDQYNPSKLLDIINDKFQKGKNKLEKSPKGVYQADSNKFQDGDPAFQFLICSGKLSVGQKTHCVVARKAPQDSIRGIEHTANGSVESLGSPQSKHLSSQGDVTAQGKVNERASGTRNIKVNHHDTTEYGIKISPFLLASENVREITSARNESVCVNSLLNKGKGVSCIEPDVRTTGTLGLRIERFLPISTIKIARGTKIPSYLNIQESPSSILTSTFFRVGISACLVVGILMLFLIYYKFTPFRSRIRSRKSTRKRIRYDDYDDYPTVIFGKISAPRRRHTKNIRILERYYMHEYS